MPETIIDSNNLFIYPDVKSREELFRLFHDDLYKRGLVKKEFYKTLSEREESYPTGLDTGEYKIAVPHTDPGMINMQGVAVATLRKPVSFKEMGAPHKSLDISIVFLLMIKDCKAGFYHNLLNKIKNSDILHKIYNTDDRQELCLLLTELLNT